MPVDPLDLQEMEEEAEAEGKASGRAAGNKRRFTEFECPTCSANNPLDFGAGDELSCGYCGVGFLAKVDEEGTLELREL